MEAKVHGELTYCFIVPYWGNPSIKYTPYRKRIFSISSGTKIYLTRHSMCVCPHVYSTMYIVLYYIFGMHMTRTDTPCQSVTSHFPRDYASLGLTQASSTMTHARSTSVKQLSAQMLVWNPSITDTIGTQHFVHYSEVSLTQGLPVWLAWYCIIWLLSTMWLYFQSFPLLCTLAGSTTSNSTNLMSSCLLQQRWWTILLKRLTSVC